jgi:hypothetical protein
MEKYGGGRAIVFFSTLVSFKSDNDVTFDVDAAAVKRTIPNSPTLSLTEIRMT